MNSILPFDTETTGLVKSNLPLNDPAQPHLVSCSALQVTEPDLFVRQSFSKVVIPAEWDWDDSPESEDRAFQVHGLSVDYCSEFGRSEKEVLDEVLHLWERTNLLVAHNLSFDQNVIACAIARYYGNGQVLKDWLSTDGFCTMKQSKELVGARTKPNAKGMTRLKNPNLAEAYEFFTGEPLTDHHSANRDAVACLQIYAGIKSYGQD